MARQAGDGWSKAKIELLTLMAAAGHTAADVAIRLGTSRSAVLGKANRLGIRFTGQAVPVEPGPGPAGMHMPSDTAEMPLVEAIEAARKTGPAPTGAASVVHRRGAGKSKVVSDDIGVPERLIVRVPQAAKRDEVQSLIDDAIDNAPARLTTPKGWPKPAGPNAVSLQDLRAHHCRMPLWGDFARTGLFCGEPSEAGRSYCAACRPLIPDARQGRTVQERAANSAKFTAAGRTGAFT
ncbi:putative Global cell cycle regulator GcrA [Bosea sp. 62]|uniref:GcrA family cell cycle regulator n=1 Tax=unclassified Bosea (in: a-proteobacteria) TaxID=2653178 RepID=UPI00125574E4|nr:MULTISPECIES: GcrA family cell cycle regulator [unclassified Bosea (in: a-proteobacteria)]CAD5255928.1 putative Global cell cycle regulator GcrA [Bosea sp. 7B]CAD5274792.1 putative Global cell cycle regulator GcrA [Bosea sp. 21B]CAD5275954.1 putative Global cell cycle regulator GcrA [Bosea sp. 46]VVT60062.1 putative Global cell cycle regulator GcrA [Bosea sp. EC-HK365B]VXB53591.1 putative Global cell cycle regulator GcrA [Bosea sp. 62]